MKRLGGQHQVQFGTTIIKYELVYSARKTLAIHVYPDTSIVVDAPYDTRSEEVERKVLKRAAWVLRQQSQFREYAVPQSLPQRYVSGESYRYLGRQYRLKIMEQPVERVLLSRGYLTVSLHDPSGKARIAQLIEGWYRRHAQTIFEERLTACYPRVASLGIPYPELAIRKMKTRWGSCTPLGRILLNLQLIQVSKDLIDYVVLHELCHLKEHNHSRAFYVLLDRALPDWSDRRRRLNQIDLR